MCVCGVNDIQSDREYDARNAWLIIIFFFGIFLIRLYFLIFRHFSVKNLCVACVCLKWSEQCEYAGGWSGAEQIVNPIPIPDVHPLMSSWPISSQNCLIFFVSLQNYFIVFLVVFGLACYSLLNRLDNVCVCVYVMRVIAKNRLISISFVSFSVLELILGWNG